MTAFQELTGARHRRLEAEFDASALPDVTVEAAGSPREEPVG